MVTGDPVHYVAGGGTITPRLADDILYRHAHPEQKPKPTGLDWDALTPTCPSCATKSGQIDATGLCPRCRGDRAVNVIHANVTTDQAETYQTLDAEDVTARFTAPTQAPQGEAAPTDVGAPVVPSPSIPTGTAMPSTPRPAVPTVRAKVRRTGTHDVVITLRSTADPIDQVRVAALISDLLTALTPQSPATAPRPSPVSGAAAGPQSEGRRPVGKQARPSDTPTRPRRIIGTQPTRRRPTSTFPLAEAQRLYLEEQMTVAQVAKHLHRGIGTVRTKLKEADTPMRDDRAGHSGGRNKKVYDSALVNAVRRLYLDERLTIAQVAERLHTTSKVIGTVMSRYDIPARPDAFTTEGHPRRDNAGPLKAQIVALGVTSMQIKTWALHQGLIEKVTRGVPSKAVVDAYAAAHPTPADPATSTSTTEGDTAA